MQQITLHAPALPADVSVLMFRAHESLAEVPTYTLEIACAIPSLDLNTVLGSPTSVTIDMGQGGLRYFSAYAFSVHDNGELDNRFVYQLTLKSWMSFLEIHWDSHIFQKMTVPEIVEEIFTENGFTDYRFELNNSYPPREYCVQYGENCLHFVMRLLQQEGLYLGIEHDAQKHTIVISDAQTFPTQVAPYDVLEFLPDSEEMRAIDGRQGIQRLHRVRRSRADKIVLRDFDYLAPSTPLQASAAYEDNAGTRGQFEVFGYAAGYDTVEHGELLARIQLDAAQGNGRHVRGDANAQGMNVGCAFTLTGHPNAMLNQRYYLIDTTLSWWQQAPTSSSVGSNFSAHYVALPDGQAFRPVQTLHKPSISGIQSATVVGPVGSEVHTDALGRIRVHFHWDRYHSTEEDSSCWLRVAKAAHGKGWGFVAIPRVGQEVLVSYLDGDIDRPLAVGIVYNGDNPLPYNLPNDIRYSGMVSRSLQNCLASAASQITFDDNRGYERLMMHAERDLQSTSERNTSVAVGNHASISVARILTIVAGSAITTDALPASSSGDASAATSDASADASRPTVDVNAIKSSANGIKNSATGIKNSADGVKNSVTGVSDSAISVNDSVTGIKNSLTGLSNSVTGINKSLTGLSSSSRGLSASVTGETTSLYGATVTLTGIRISFTALSVNVTGISASFTGSSVSMTGSSVNFTGVKSDFRGISSTFTGISVIATGISMSITGQSTSFTGVSTSLTGMSTSVIGVKASMTGISASMTGTSLSMTGSSVSMAGISLTIVGQQTKVTGQETSVTGMSTTITDNNASVTGVLESTTLLSVSQTNMSQATTNTSTSTTGMSISVKNESNVTIGREEKQRSTQVEITNFEEKNVGTELVNINFRFIRIAAQLDLRKLKMRM
ncbi:type VI secretion system tip protein TssI/VgrG [Paraburkholderia susongensis]|uniref:Type VI secretion system secreted protein VgrG n=1 Tax=Paraburkholderia susongensis TaxID=1515439 RepID=A0A1X7M4M1_9BURK|nr:type VI secretion system tip protein TssI/VgrG [Paraburkholderia susongensis]SMG61138.1 type VI secretion system secreted protein VgrG [Paraburkholderia susongensis]